MSTGTEERYVVHRTIPAPPSAIFAVLTDPNRHQDTEPTDWVRDAIDPQPITAVGQVFGINMFIEAAGGHYVMHNRVTALEPDRIIEWIPGQYSKEGELQTGGWTWRYDLAETTAGTDVTLTYDWSATPDVIRREIGGLPPFGPDFLDQSLATLEKAVTT